MKNEGGVVGHIVVIARDPNSEWMQQLRRVAAACELDSIVFDSAECAAAIARCNELGMPTRLLIHIQEIDESMASALTRCACLMGGRIILLAHPGWHERIAAQTRWRGAMLAALPHAVKCVGEQALTRELERLTTNRGAW